MGRSAQGDATAQNNLGFQCEKGQGVSQDYVEAIKWYRLAAAQGHSDAQYSLGVMYQLGQGIPEDYVRAHMWFNLGAVSGDTWAVAARKHHLELFDDRPFLQSPEARAIEAKKAVARAGRR